MARYGIGPGTIIKKTLAAWGITDKPGCGCNDLAIEMNQDGPDIVEQRLEDYYIPQMSESIKKWRGIVKSNMPQPPVMVIRKLINYGIEKSKQSGLVA